MALFEADYPPYVSFGSRYLYLQSPPLRGTDVALVQSIYNLMLETMNPPLGPMGSPIKVDGVFGESTRQAVRNIQSYFGLATDGVVGPDTGFVFGQGTGDHVTYGGPVFDSRDLVQGDSGGDVTILQNRLNCFRYASIIGEPATGTFNAATAAAVISFKQDATANGDTGLADNAIVGYGAYDALFLYTFAGGRGIFTGRNGFDVVFVQVILRDLGYYAGHVDGYYGAATVDAVKAFQTHEGIAVDGVVGPVTFYHIGLNNQKPAPRPLAVIFP